MIYTSRIWILFFSIVGIFSEVSASTSSPEAMKKCTYAGLQLGKGYTHKSSIYNYCYSQALEMLKDRKQLYASAKQGNTKLAVVGFQNALYIRRDNDFSVIAGDMSQLSDIQAVTISSDGSTVAVLNMSLDSKGKRLLSILQFKSSQNGNVVPFLINNDLEVSFAKLLQFSQDGQNIVLLLEKINSSNQKEFSVVSYLSAADSRSPIESNKPRINVMVPLGAEAIHQPSSVLMLDKLIVVLDSSSGVFAYNVSEKKQKLVSQLATDSEHFKKLKDISLLRYSSEAKSIYVIDSIGNYTTVKF